MVRVVELVGAHFFTLAAGTQGLDSSLVRDAQSHLNQAKTVDPSNVIAEAFLQKVR